MAIRNKPDKIEKIINHITIGEKINPGLYLEEREMKVSQWTAEEHDNKMGIQRITPGAGTNQK